MAPSLATGRWGGIEENEAAPDERRHLNGVKPFVTDTRNLLFASVADPAKRHDAFMKSLGYALRRAMQACFQVEEQEIVVELIGQGDGRRLLDRPLDEQVETLRPWLAE